MVERVDEPFKAFDKIEQARHVADGFHAPQKLYDERDDALRKLRQAALAGGDDFTDLTPDAIAAAIADIERREQARKLRQMPS